ncbi:MAG: hypothetical protein HWE10_11165 [Gammaproteobacteria bacterium]|nr:hypothetical protein [Gammaproteobacteria bacterium]
MFNSEVIGISPQQLNDYWQVDAPIISMLKRRPTWLPKGKGGWTFLTVFDSNGDEVKRTLISSSHEGCMTQNKIDQIPKTLLSL